MASGSAPPTRPRVGIVDYLNSRPLAWSFLQGEHEGRFETVRLPPSAVAERLARGELEIGLVPSIEAARIGGLQILPGLCVAASSEVRSVLLVLGRPPAEVRRVALDENSRTSAALVRILLKERWGLEPDYVSAPPRLPAMLEAADAALLIGDPALRVDREAHRVLDLAAEWRALTGLPFVFAVWAVRETVEAAGLAAVFEESYRRARRELPRLVAEASAELGLGRAEVRRYLTENLSYRLGAEERAGLAEFLRRACAHGLLAAPGPPAFVEAEAEAAPCPPPVETVE